MAETQTASVRPADPVGRALFLCSYFLVLVGGLLMSALIVMVVVSVLGRWLLSMPIPGDFELVTMGTAVTVFLFLPYCHLQRGNVVIDLFLFWAPRGVQSAFDALSGLVLAATAGGLAWRLVHGGFDMREYGETSYILALPVWPVFPIAVLSMGLLAACCLYTAIRDMQEAVR